MSNYIKEILICLLGVVCLAFLVFVGMSLYKKGTICLSEKPQIMSQQLK